MRASLMLLFAFFLGIFVIGLPTAAADKGKPKDKPKTKVEKVAADKLAAYRKHLSAGRKLGDQKKWGEAVVEFEAALKEIPLDGRALSELGWAAFAAGDYPKAKKANEESIRVAAELKVKAASLYNLGRVAEATGDKEGAIRAYATSLVYRPGNKTVLDALVKVQKAAPAAAHAAEAPSCAETTGSIGKVCTCLAKDATSDDAEVPATCEADDDAEVPEPFHVVRVSVPSDSEVDRYLLIEADDGMHVVAALATTYNPGMAGVSEEWGLASAKIESAGGHKLLWLREGHSHIDNDRGINETESSDDNELTVCVLGGKKTPTTCPLKLTETHSYIREVLFDDDTEDHEKHTGLPRTEGYELSVKVDGATGVATVKLVKGAADEAVSGVVGPHKLW